MRPRPFFVLFVRGQSSLEGGASPDREMNAAIVLEHEVHRNGVSVILDLLAVEGVVVDAALGFHGP
jgi:hypothetical protein